MIVFILCLLCAPAGPGFSDSITDCLDEETVLSILGMTPDEALETVASSFGNPREVYISRAEDAEKDSVVFYYHDNLYLFLHSSRVWQIRLDERYKGRVFGLDMGAGVRAVRDKLGEPEEETDNRYLYHMKDKGYPVLAAFYFTDSRLTDFYLYRGDL